MSSFQDQAIALPLPVGVLRGALSSFSSLRLAAVALSIATSLVACLHGEFASGGQPGVVADSVKLEAEAWPDDSSEAMPPQCEAMKRAMREERLRVKQFTFCFLIKTSSA